MVRIALLLFVLIFATPAFSASEPKDEFKEQLMGSGQTQILAVRELESRKRFDLIPVLSDLLRNQSASFELVDAILDFYQKSPELERYNSIWPRDVEWLSRNRTKDSILVRVLQFVAEKRDKRLFFSVTPFYRSTESTFRHWAFKAMGELQDDRMIPLLLGLAKSGNPIDRLYFLESMQFVRDERLSKEIFPFYEDPSPAVRRMYLKLIDSQGIESRTYQIVRSATVDPDYDVRLVALELLKNRPTSQYNGLFARMLSDDNRDIRRISIEAAVQKKDRSFAPSLSDQLIRENESFLRSRMIDALLACGSHGGGQGLVTVLRKEEDPEVRKKAALAIGVLGYNPGSNALLDRLHEESVGFVRLQIIDSLGELKDRSSVGSLLELSGSLSESSPIRKQAIQSIEKIGDPKALPNLFDLYVKEPAPSIKKELEESIRALLHHEYR